MFESFIALDLETTGLDFDKDEIIEIALVHFIKGQINDSRSYLIKPSQELRPFIQALTGISMEDIEQAQTFETLAKEIFDFIGNHPIIAHNAQFDFKFLKKSFAAVDLDFSSHPVFDSLTLSRIAYRHVANHRLETLVKYLNIERSASHRALPDAQACGKLFYKAFNEIQNFSPFEKNSLAALAKNTLWESVFNEDSSDSRKIIEPLSIELNVSNSQKTTQEILPRVNRFFEPEGILHSKMPDYIQRETQIDFAEVVERNMYKGGISILEAETGTGKTLAYLIPAVLKAFSGERVIISTATRALQEQLWQKDFPVVMSLFSEKINAVLLKGRQNYICYRKYQETLEKAEILLTFDEIEFFMALVPWVERTRLGDINENTGFNWKRHRALWAKVASDAASCTGEKCRFYSKCPALCARKEAMQSNLIFVNHSLFLADLALDFALLPVYEHIVFDEAHRLPALSHQAFGKSLRFFRFKNTVKTLMHPKLENKGFIADFEKIFDAHHHAKGINLCSQLKLSIVENEKLLHRLFMKIGKNLTKQKNSDFRYKQNITIEYGVDFKPLLTELNQTKTLMSAITNCLREIEKSFEDSARDLEGLTAEITSFIRDFEFLAKSEQDDWVFYLEEPFNPHTLQMKALPLMPGNTFAEKFYPWVKSVTMTSATLSTQGRPDYFYSKMGLTHSSLPKQKEPFFRRYESPFDIHRQRKILIADFLPKPGTLEYQKALENLLVRLLPQINRNTMALFTSIASMTGAYKALSKPFADNHKLLLSQHIDGGMDNLIEMFRKERNSCLLGSQLLWEGVDLPGEALELLVIPKLPFPNPSEPLIAALSDEMKLKKENGFKNLFIPEALLELRQGIGRLIRGEKDSGILLLLDSRLVTESYGKSFTRLWNHQHQIVQNEDDLCKALGVEL